MSAEARKKVRQALADANLQTALARFTMLVKLGRQIGMDGIDFESMRADLHSRKDRAIADLPSLITDFKKNASSAGAIVYEAASTESANAYVTHLAKSRNISNVVKSKSMLTEEISLREHMERSGITVVETDIGERIVQLAGERPAHIVGPAIHKTAEQISSLFSKMLGRMVSTESQALLDEIRGSLRQSYFTAGMGISGANIAIAESGTLVILTNEGNGQMVTTLPPIHVAIVGIEKLVHDFNDANSILRILSRSCVGTKMTVYTSFITGVSNSGNLSSAPLPGGQGPRELHIVLVDNGRNKLRSSEAFRESLFCIKCGACLNVCPVFASLAGQTYGHVYQGGIGTILTAFFHDRHRAFELSEMCMGCLMCKSVCPAAINIPGLIRELRNDHVNSKGFSLAKSLLYNHILKYPDRLEISARIGTNTQRPFVGNDSMIARLPFPLNHITDTISLPPISSSPLGKSMKSRAFIPVHNRPSVAFFAGCINSYAYPEIGGSVFRLLERCGTTPYFPIRQTCCGAPPYFAGNSAVPVELCSYNISALLKEDPDYVVTTCPGCAVMLREVYPVIVADKPDIAGDAVRLSKKVYELSQLLMLFPTHQKASKTGAKRVTYHDPCHLKRGLGISLEPRQLISLSGHQLVEMNDPDTCCGFGGDALIAHPELCGSILQRKLANIEATGTDTVVTACTACVLQLRGGLHKRKSAIKVIHLAELLDGKVL